MPHATYRQHKNTVCENLINLLKCEESKYYSSIDDGRRQARTQTKFKYLQYNRAQKLYYRPFPLPQLPLEIFEICKVLCNIHRKWHLSSLCRLTKQNT